MEAPNDLLIFDKINDFNATVEVSELTIGEKYCTNRVKRIQFKYGEAIVVDLERKQVFLPGRYKKMNDVTIVPMNYCPTYY